MHSDRVCETGQHEGHPAEQWGEAAMDAAVEDVEKRGIGDQLLAHIESSDHSQGLEAFQFVGALLR